MTVLARRSEAFGAGAPMPPGLKRLAFRRGDRPGLEPKWPCEQVLQISPAPLVAELELVIMKFEGVSTANAPFDAPGTGFVLTDELARGQPEAFINGTCWLALAPTGAMHLSLRPEWAQKVVNHGWATVHPFARYMAGAVPPQSLVAFAPRDRTELIVAGRIAAAAHSYAVGRIGNLILPDTRW